MIKYVHILFLLALFSTTVLAQREYKTSRVTEEVIIDGHLTEEIWNSVPIATDFTVNYPDYGDKSRFESQVQVVYNDEALYVAANLIDPKPDSVSYSLSQRDDMGNADWFGLGIDPYGTNVSQFTFIVTAAGVEIDGLQYVSQSDYSWNAVWKSAVQRTETGWAVEIRIPFSAIRFSNSNIHEWSINFGRSVRRNRQYSTWNPVNPEVFGEITQSGILKGIENVTPPLRLSLTPYVTTYLENSKSDVNSSSDWKGRVTGGLDLKYGINDAFTLDMTLVPDFGQTTSDQKVLNLSPFEVRYNENRPFFLEGIDLFGKGDVFYSRRIGDQPIDYNRIASKIDSNEYIKSNPAVASLLNATKISGRTKSGLGIGFFNAIERPSYATIGRLDGEEERQVLTNPTSNYNVVVLSQNLKNNSSVSFVNTNVTRAGDYRDANVSVLTGTVYSDDGSHEVSTTVKVSNVFEDSVLSTGHNFKASIAKVSGTLGYFLSYEELSDKFDPNDLGFLYNNNTREYTGGIRWNDYTPGNYFLRKWGETGLVYLDLYRPQKFFYSEIYSNFRGTTRNFLTFGFDANYSPFGEVNHFLSAVPGKEVIFNPAVAVSGFYSSDYSKRFALDFNGWVKEFFNTPQIGIGATISPRIRMNDRMFMVWQSSYEFLKQDFGYIIPFDENYSNRAMIGHRDRKTVINSLSSEFIFTKRMGVNLRFRHYWSQVEYFKFTELLNEGVQVATDYASIDHNTSYNAFTIDINYRWVFIPGSEIRVVYKNNIFNFKNGLDGMYFNTFDTLFDQPQINSISLKLLVYVDALAFRRKKGSVQ